MPILSIAECARRAGVDPSTIRRKIDRGLLSVSTRADGNKGIELSELARLYPQAVATRGVPEQTTAADLGPLQRDVELLRLRQEVDLLKQQLNEAQADKTWLQGQVEQLQRLLSAPPRRPADFEAVPTPRKGPGFRSMMRGIGEWFRR